jgi:hypothetical protein
MSSLTRRRDPLVDQETWRIYYGEDVSHSGVGEAGRGKSAQPFLVVVP